MQDLGKTKNVEVLGRLVTLNDRHVVDVGCGNLTFTKLLTGLGARVLAIDPDPIQAEKNRLEPIQNIDFYETPADKIPVKDKSMDGVFFSYSLHHIPAEIYPAVFAEVIRILRPDGFLYVLEPIDCPMNKVMRLFHNEDLERKAAWDALNDIAKPGFRECSEYTYHDEKQYASWEDYASQYSGKTFNPLYTEADVRRDEVRQEFLKQGGDHHIFKTPKNVMLLRGLKP